MITVKQLLKNLQELVKLKPECENYQIIYSHDDEGNEYQGVIYEPSLCKARNEDGSSLNLKQNYRFLELVGFYGDGERKHCFRRL